MTKYHISKNGEVKACRARVKPCPLGGANGNENHFDTKEEAQAFLSKLNENEFGVVSELKTRKKKGKSKEIIQKELSDFIYDSNLKRDLGISSNVEVDMTSQGATIVFRDFNSFEADPFEEDDDWPDFVGGARIEKVFKKYLAKFGDSVKFNVVGEEKYWVSVHIEIIE